MRRLPSSLQAMIPSASMIVSPSNEPWVPHVIIIDEDPQRAEKLLKICDDSQILSVSMRTINEAFRKYLRYFEGGLIFCSATLCNQQTFSVIAKMKCNFDRVYVILTGTIKGARTLVRAFHAGVDDWIEDPADLRQARIASRWMTDILSRDVRWKHVLLSRNSRSSLVNPSNKKIPTVDKHTMTHMEYELILQGLELCSWNKSKAAKRLGISRGTLYRKIAAFKM